MATPRTTTQRRFVREYLRTMDPDRAAQTAGAAGQGPALLETEAVREEIDRQRRIMKSLMKKDDLLRRMWELAFSRSNDCARLVLEDPAQVSAQLEGLDLSLLAELRRTDKGAVEVKLIDRLQLLERLLALLDQDEGSATEFLQALAGMGEEA